MSSDSFFDIDADTLHTIVTDHEQGLALLHTLGGPKGIAKRIKTHPSRGLDVDEGRDVRAAREAHFSTNVLPEAEEVSFMDIVKECLEDRMLQILIVSAFISLVLGLTIPDEVTGLIDYAHGWIEGAAILLSVVLVTVVSSVNNYEKEQKFKELTRVTPPVMVSVVRGGRTMEITDRELLVGDVLNIFGGDVLTVDGIVLRSSALKVDESAATGENDDITKTVHGDCVLRSGSNVVEGEGTILVTGVGVNSFAGRIAMQVREGKEETPLQEKLTVLADQIGYLGMAAAVLMFTILSLKELYDTFVLHTHPFYYKKYLDNLTTAVTIVVVAVPEGLPLSVTIALAYSMQQMFKENNLVRHLAACETMGGATTICTDKTGTITQNEMTVTDGITAAGEDFYVPLIDRSAAAAAASSPTTKAVAAQLEARKDVAEVFQKGNAQHAKLRRLLLEGIAVNTKCHRKSVMSPTTAVSTTKLTGNKTEQALLNFAERLGEDPIALRGEVLGSLEDCKTTGSDTSSPSSTPPPASAFPSPSSSSGGEADYSGKEMAAYPFSSARKRMTTALALRNDGVIRFHVKGASELVLARCQWLINANGERVPMDADTREVLQLRIMSMARRRLRTLALAYQEEALQVATTATVNFPETDEHLHELTLLSIVGIRDPVRPEVPRAIAQCRSAGVTVRMITGDNKATAVSIAKEVGIYGPVWFGPKRGEQGLALEGSKFREIAKSARGLNSILPRLQVISRASPLDKQILVSALMQRGEVVAVTGDGTNDAPALKNASVGFSMNSGTEVAKNASDVVILDDNFSTIVTAMKWGRNVNDNISKFLQFQMTVNVAAVVVSFLGSLMDGQGESPLKPVQLLWLNLIMDTLAALALATETPAEEVLDRPPKPKQAPLISMRMWANILGQSVYQVGLQLWLLSSGFNYFNVEYYSEEHLTVIFNVFVLLQLFNEFNARILDHSLFVFKGIRRAPLFLAVVGTTFVIQVLGVQYGGAVMRAVPLSQELWYKCFLLSMVPFPLGVLLRCIPIAERTLAPAPVIIDDNEEMALTAAAIRRSRPTLKETVKQVMTQQRVIRAFALNASQQQKKKN